MFRRRVIACLAPLAVAAAGLLPAASASAEVVVVEDGPSVEYLATVEPIYYEDRAVYWWHDHWYYRNAYGGWGYYDREPGFLYNRRLNAPPGRWSYEPHGWGGRGWGGGGWGGPGGGHGAWDSGGHGAPGQQGHGSAPGGHGGAAPAHGGSAPSATHGGAPSGGKGAAPPAAPHPQQPSGTAPSGGHGGGGWGGHGGGGGAHGGGGHR